MEAGKKRIWVRGQYVEVTDEVYMAYTQGDRKMRYFENDLKTERFVLGKEGQVVRVIPSREDSLDRLMDENNYYKYVNGQCIKSTVTPTPGGHQKNHPELVYAIDFDVTPHQLRHTYITNLLYAGVDPKTVQYLAGHENSKTTMDIYAKVKYNKPEDLCSVVNEALGQ